MNLYVFNLQIPAGTYATASPATASYGSNKRQRHQGAIYQWKINYNGLKYMFGEIDVAINQVKNIILPCDVSELFGKVWIFAARCRWV